MQQWTTPKRGSIATQGLKPQRVRAYAAMEPMDVVATIMCGASMATALNAQEKTNQQAKILAMTGHRWVAAALLPNCLMPNQKQYSKTSTSTPQSSNSGADKNWQA